MTPRLRIARLVEAYDLNKHGRLSVHKASKSVHIKLDGWDVASMDEHNLGYNSAQLRKAEELLGLSVDTEN